MANYPFDTLSPEFLGRQLGMMRELQDMQALADFTSDLMQHIAYRCNTSPHHVAHALAASCTETVDEEAWLKHTLPAMQEFLGR